MKQSSPQPTQHFRGKLTRTSVLLLLPLTIIPIALIGFLILFNTTRFLREQVIVQFNNVTQTQIEQITHQVEDSQLLLQELENDERFSEALERAMSTDSLSPQWQKNRADLISDLNRVSHEQTRHVFNNIAIVTPENEIFASTNSLIVGNTLDSITLKELLSESTSLLYFDTNQLTDKQSDRLKMITSRLLYDGLGNKNAILIGITGSDKFARILEIGKLSHPQARPYYIANSDLGAVFVGLSPTTGDITSFNPSRDHLDTVMPKVNIQEKSSLVEFDSFNDIPVLGFANWVDSFNAAIVLEIPQTGISDPVRGLIIPQIALLLIMLIFLGVIIWLGTRRLVRPIEEISATAREFADGDMLARAMVDRNDEIGLLANSFNHVADQHVALYQSLESMIESRTQQIKIASEVAQVVTSTTNLEDILSQTVNLINERFNFYHTAIYLMDRGGDNIVLREAAGQAANDILNRGLAIAVGSHSIVGNVASTNKPWISDNVLQESYYHKLELLTETQSEAAIPLSIGGRVLGVLDIQSRNIKAFDNQDIITLQTLARQIASAIQNTRLIENTQVDLETANLLFQTSHKFADAETENDVFRSLAKILEQIPYISRVFFLESGKLNIVDISSDPQKHQNTETSIVISKDAINKILTETTSQIIQTDTPHGWIPENLRELAKEIGCQEFVTIPLISRDELLGVILIGALTKNILTPPNLELYYSIAQMSNTALEKIEARNRITASFTELQSLSELSQAISTETNLGNLFEILHRQVVQTVGKVHFLIALYDAATELVEIPYMAEGNQIISIPTFPLGKGLTSIVVRTKQPLMIVEDTINRTKALGAIVTSGKAAQSWLGVPMIVAGEVVGVLAVQDLKNEHRFDDDDLRALTTLAGQVAPTIRNARLLSVTQETAERDRQLFEVTDKIRRATSIPEIMELTVRELSQVLDLKKTTIEISTNTIEREEQTNSTEEKSK